MSDQNNKIFLKPCGVKLFAKDVKYDLSSLSSNGHRFFWVNFLINAAFEHLRMWRLLGVFIRGRRLFHFSFPKWGVYWRAALKRGHTVRKLFMNFCDPNRGTGSTSKQNTPSNLEGNVYMAPHFHLPFTENRCRRWYECIFLKTLSKFEDY